MSDGAFTLEATDGDARAGVLRTAHGEIPTPTFMPVGTQASVKGLAPDELTGAGARIILANAYHLYLRPGADTIEAAGGLHAFMGWHGPILTDSGGFQVFSLASLGTVDDDGYHFASHLDGTRHTFTPESVVALQETLGSDIAMVLDDVAPAGVDERRAREAAARTLAWAARAAAAKRRTDQLLFAIVQGSTYDAVRRENARALAALDFPGYGIGGLWVGESKAHSLAVTELVCGQLPGDKPRYVMGVGTPEDMIACIARGADMFDCVYPTRCARHALALTLRGRLNLRNARFAKDFSPIDPDCKCPACARFSRAYLAHCFRASEMIAPRVVSLHNIWTMLRLSDAARESILAGRFEAWRDGVLDGLRAGAAEG
ncbi:MAG: tRNA guanosine(34) transglycosylase Tgt [Candidatus Eremiobacteraeota bacterium]|nr:tRNA guanosine(34) transglycosylase Tgt [Candidatus Eremiobacteraeota bacterium]MBV8366886.1 tRNA guanosine(34) transglycosylase Tgt [Candidatus Eremiobacteraeota bacterium]